MRKERRVTKKADLKSLRDEMKRDMAQRARAEDRTKLLRELKRGEREKVAQGKKPFYLKSSEKKKIQQIQKFNALKSQGQGQLNSYLEKREKRMASKDRRRIPRERR